MTTPVLYASPSEIAELAAAFTVAGIPADPTAVSCTVTDPNGNTVTYTYNDAGPAATVDRVSMGSYQLQVPCAAGAGSATSGIWAYAWTGTGAATTVIPGTFTVNPVNLWQYYTTVEEIKNRLQINDTASDLTLTRIVRGASRRVEGHCGRHFFQMQDTRTYVPWSIYEQPLDDLVSVSSFTVDEDGDGNYESVWVRDTDYELAVAPGSFNQLATGEPRPWTLARVINNAGGGRFFPFVWPFSRLDRIKITGTFGWPQVPDDVHEASVEFATDLYKTKDAPFGIAGISAGGGGAFDFGAAKVSRVSPMAAGLLRPYIRSRGKVGI